MQRSSTTPRTTRQRGVRRAIGWAVLSATVAATATGIVSPAGTAAAAPQSYALAGLWNMNESGGSIMNDSGPFGINGDIGDDVTPGFNFNGATGYSFPNGSPPAAQPVNPERLATVPNDPRLNPDAADYAIEFRYRTTKSFGNIVQKGQNGTWGGYFKFEQPSGYVACLFKYNPPGGGASSQKGVKSPVQTNDGQWHTIRCEMRRSFGVMLFVDGVEVAKNGWGGQAPLPPIANDRPISIGGKSNCNQTSTTCDYFDGQIDYVRIEKGASVPPVNQPPAMSFTSSCDDLTCTFNSGGSTDIDGQIVSRSWDFGDNTTGSGQTVTHTFPAPGTYIVTLAGTDDDGATGTTSQDVAAIIATPPTADFEATCAVNLRCVFDASASGDADGTIEGYKWEWGDGGGRTDDDPNAEYTYDDPGIYPVTLTVTDDDGKQTSITKNVNAGSVNEMPDAQFLAACAGLTCTFDSSASTDDDGSITALSWSFGDGGTSTAAKPTHTFPAAGAYDVALTVTDDDGATDTEITTITVLEPPSELPTAAFGVSCAALTCAFDSSTSTDDGTIEAYSWTFGDGGTATSANPTHTYAKAGTYTVTLTVTDDDDLFDAETRSLTVTAQASQPPPGSTTRFVPLTPKRLFDTRPSESAPGPKGIVEGDSSIEVDVTGFPGIPDDVAAIAINLTAIAVGAPSYVTAWPTGDTMPPTSSLNLVSAGQVRSNTVIVPVGDGGTISLYTLRDAHLLGDVSGYYTAQATATKAGRTITQAPDRLFDTRTGEGTPKGLVGANRTIVVPVVGEAGLPDAGIDAVVLNVTATEAAGPGFVTVWDTGARPTASSINVNTAGETVPNLVIVPVDDTGAIRLSPSVATHLLGDVLGYVTDSSAASSRTGLFVPLTPDRVFDSRPSEPPASGPKGQIAAGAPITPAIAGKGGIPADAGGVLLNVTMIGTAPSFGRLWPAGGQQPTTSNVNVGGADDVRANGAVLALGAGGDLDVMVSSPAHVIADVSGWFVK